MQTKAFQEIFGNEFLYFLTPFGMPRSVKGIFTIPPQIVTPVIKDKSPYFLRSESSPDNKLVYTWNNTKREFPPDSIIHINKPKVSILTHFGMTMLKMKPWEIAENLSETHGVKVIAARDGMELDIDQYQK